MDWKNWAKNEEEKRKYRFWYRAESYCTDGLKIIGKTWFCNSKHISKLATMFENIVSHWPLQQCWYHIYSYDENGKAQWSGRWVVPPSTTIFLHIHSYSISHLFPYLFPTYISPVDHTAKWQMGICRWFLHRPVNDAPSVTNNCHPWVTRHKRHTVCQRPLLLSPQL